MLHFRLMMHYDPNVQPTIVGYIPKYNIVRQLVKDERGQWRTTDGRMLYHPSHFVYRREWIEEGAINDGSSRIIEFHRLQLTIKGTLNETF